MTERTGCGPNPHTPTEQRVMDLLAEAWNEFVTLEQTHPSHIGEFQMGIHQCQAVMTHRIVQRDYPHVYPTRKG